MRSFVFQVATFLIVATAAFSQNPGGAASTSQVSQKGEQQILQIEAEMLKGEMNSDPAVVEKIYADDCINPSRADWSKAELVKGVREHQGQAPPYIATEEDMHVYVLGDTAIAMYVKKYPCLAETMGRFRFRKPAQRVIKRDFHGIVGAKSVGTSGYHTKFVVEALDGTVGDLSFGTKPIQQ